MKYSAGRLLLPLLMIAGISIIYLDAHAGGFGATSYEVKQIDTRGQTSLLSGVSARLFSESGSRFALQLGGCEFDIGEQFYPEAMDDLFTPPLNNGRSLITALTAKHDNGTYTSFIGVLENPRRVQITLPGIENLRCARDATHVVAISNNPSAPGRLNVTVMQLRNGQYEGLEVFKHKPVEGQFSIFGFGASMRTDIFTPSEERFLRDLGTELAITILKSFVNSRR